MRNLQKLTIPEVLKDNAADWLKEYLADPENQTKRYRYRNPDIKDTLKDETGFKCIYCESKIGHNTPGDIEHKIPSSKDRTKHFDWDNLTIACTECNRRKNDYYEKGDEFLDPYNEDVESKLRHLGPLVYWMPGHNRAENSVRILELYEAENRLPLVIRKAEKLEDVSNQVERAFAAASPLRDLLLIRLRKMASVKAEYSAMVLTALEMRWSGEKWR